MAHPKSFDEELAERDLSLDHPIQSRSAKLPAVPVWASIQSGLVLTCLSVLVGVTALHWGGAYDHVAVPLMFCGVVLWTIIFALGVQSYFLKQRIGDWVDVCVLAFLAYSIFSFARSEAGFPARMEYLWTWTYGGVFLAARYGIHSRDWMIGWLVFLVAIASGVCLYALIHIGDPTHLIWGLPRPGYVGRISGTFGCPNHFANFMAMSVFAAFLLGTYSRFPWPLRIFFFYLAAMFTVGVFFSVSRGGYLAWIFGMTVISGYVLRTVQLRWWWKASAIVSVLTGVVITITRNDFVLGRLEQTLGGDVRLRLIVDAIRIWKEDRWFGTGTASFDFFHMRLTDFPTGRAIYTHNDYMNTLSDYGAVGLGLVLLFLLVYLITLILNGRSLRSERESLVWRIGLCCLAAMAIHETVDFNLHIPACALAFFTLTGMAISRTYRQRRTRRFWLSAAPLCMIGSVFALTQVTPLLMQTWKGQQLASYSEEELLAMSGEEIKKKADEAYAVDPGALSTQIAFANALRVKAGKMTADLRRSASRSLQDHREAEQLARDALTIYDRVYEANPLDDSLLIKKAMTHDAIGRFAEASLFYSQALRLRPHSGNFHFAVGHHYLQRGQLRPAHDSFLIASRQGVQANPEIAVQVAKARDLVRQIRKILQKKETS